MKTVFAITCSSTTNSLRDAKFFSTKELAQKSLKKMADERRYKLGVKCLEETDDLFSYLFGWEEHMVSFRIVEIAVETE